MPTRTDHWSREPGRWEPTLAPEAWATIPRIQAPRVSPDRTKVAYIRGYDGRNDVWVLDLDDGHPIRLTDRATPQGPDPSQRQAFPIAWTPDSRTVVYASSEAGKLWAVPADGGKARPVEEAAGNHHSPDVAPDGRKVTYVAERGEAVDIFVSSLDGAQSRQVSSSDADEYVALPQWSPDGQALIYVQWPHYDMPWDEIAVVVTSASDESRQVVAGGERVANNWPRWSPDGDWIAFTSDREGEHPNLWRMRPDGSKAKRLFKDDHDHHRPCWSPDGKKIVFTRNADNENQIWVWNGRKARQITEEPGVHSDLTWVDDDHILCIYESPMAPPDLWMVSLDGDRRRLTQSATGGVLGADLTLPEVISWESRDRLEITGMLFTPEQTREGEHPLIVYIHGGPVSQANKTWVPWIQYLVQRGYVVLVPNYRGSKGYGRSFMEKLYGDWGGGDLDDNVTGVEAVIERGLVDPDQVVASGGSAGGYSTLICMTKAPDIFKAGVARYGIADLKTFHRETWIFERHYVQKLMGGTGGARSGLYADRSPINFVENVRNPILILQGDSDIVCHPSEMNKMNEALEKAGKDVEYRVYEGEGHGWKKMSTIIDDAKRSDAFLISAVLES